MTDMAQPDHDPETGEIIENRAADGGQRYPAAHSLADFIRMQEDGQFDDAFNKACERVKTETSLPLLIGAPE